MRGLSVRGSPADQLDARRIGKETYEGLRRRSMPDVLESRIEDYPPLSIASRSKGTTRRTGPTETSTLVAGSDGGVGYAKVVATVTEDAHHADGSLSRIGFLDGMARKVAAPESRLALRLRDGRQAGFDAEGEVVLELWRRLDEAVACGKRRLGCGHMDTGLRCPCAEGGAREWDK
jgi:hypothetical protein